MVESNMDRSAYPASEHRDSKRLASAGRSTRNIEAIGEKIVVFVGAVAWCGCFTSKQDENERPNEMISRRFNVPAINHPTENTTKPRFPSPQADLSQISSGLWRAEGCFELWLLTGCRRSGTSASTVRSGYQTIRR